MIFKTLPELIEQKNRILREIEDYDSIKMWKEVFKKMSIPEKSISYQNNDRELTITISDLWNVYSWYLPKGVYYMKVKPDNKLTIIMPHNMGTIRENQ